jgi:hypothetical protein
VTGSVQFVRDAFQGHSFGAPCFHLGEKISIRFLGCLVDTSTGLLGATHADRMAASIPFQLGLAAQALKNVVLGYFDAL